MKIPALPFTVTDWSEVSVTVHPGETGQALWRTLNIGELRVRMVEYTPGYLPDHWCDRGHVLYVLEGELDTELRDGRPQAGHELPGVRFRRRRPPIIDQDRREAFYRGLSVVPAHVGTTRLQRSTNAFSITK
jgi:hypothetical protein